jgi:hypothetical protein
MGLSRGWGDTYGAFTVGQYLDITDLADGRYRVRVKADGDSSDGTDRFLESDGTNPSACTCTPWAPRTRRGWLAATWSGRAARGWTRHDLSTEPPTETGRGPRSVLSPFCKTDASEGPR